MLHQQEQRFHLTLSLLCRYGWLVPALMLVSLPAAGGPRPLFWVSVALGLLTCFFGIRTIPSDSSRRLLFMWAGLVLPVLLSWPGSYDPTGTLKVLGVLACALPAGLFWLSAFADARRRGIFDRALLLVVIVWCFDGTLQAVTGFDFLGVPLTDDGRVAGPFKGNLRFPVYLSLLLSSAVCLFALRGRQTTALWLWLLGASIALLGGTRAQSITLLVGAVLMFPAFSPPARRALAALALVVVAGWAAIRLSNGSGEALFNSLQWSFDQDRWFSTLDMWSSSRLSSWRAAIAMGMDRFAGVGASAFTEAYPFYTAPDDSRIAFAGSGMEINHAHHVWFAIFAETGFLGVAGLFAAVAMAGYWWCVSEKKARDSARPYAVALGAYFFPGALHPPLYLFWIFPVIWMLVCAYLSAISAGTCDASGGDSPRA